MTQQVKPSTLAAMDRWVLYRSAGSSGGVVGGSGLTGVLGGLQGGKRVQTCRRCEGKKFIIPQGYKTKRRCPNCDGDGEFLEDLAPKNSMRIRPCEFCTAIVNGKRQPTGEINGRTCHKCRGSKLRTIIKRTIHPAMIRSTRGYFMPEFGSVVSREDKISGRINREVFSWLEVDAKVWWHYVTMAAYDLEDRRTQEQKAAQMGISPQFFSKTLKLALLKVQEVIESGI